MAYAMLQDSSHLIKIPEKAIHRETECYSCKRWNLLFLISQIYWDNLETITQTCFLSYIMSGFMSGQTRE